MDVASAQSIMVLECIAAMQWGDDCAVPMASSSGGRKHHISRFNLRRYQSGTNLETYVEAELEDGKVICWWLEVGWNREQWRIEPSVLVNDDHGQRVLKDFPATTLQTLDDFIGQLKEATSDLAAYARSMDLGPACV